MPFDNCGVCGNYGPTQAGKCSGCNQPYLDRPDLRARETQPVAWSCLQMSERGDRCEKWCGREEICLSSPRSFSDFIRNASDAEKLAVYTDVMKKATDMQITEQTDLVLPKCPHCGAEDSMEHHRVRFPDAPLDADWDECVVCNHKTDPE